MGAGLLFRCMQVNRGGFPIGAWEKSGCQFAGTRSAPFFRGICFGGLLSHVTCLTDPTLPTLSYLPYLTVPYLTLVYLTLP